MTGSQPASSAGGLHEPLPVRVAGPDDLPVALSRLARLVAVARHLQPKTVAWIAADHARTLITLADVLARRDTVPGATAPPLLGAPTELRAHAATLAAVRASVRNLRSAHAEDPRPLRQLREIRRQVRHDDRRMSRGLTDADLHGAIAMLRPALLVAPAVAHTIDEQLAASIWYQPTDRFGTGWRRPAPGTVAAITDATHAASATARRLARWLPEPPPAPRSAIHPSVQRADQQVLRRSVDRFTWPADRRKSAAATREASGAQPAC